MAPNLEMDNPPLVPEAEPPVAESESVPKDGFDWVEFNRQKRAEALTWVKSKPYERLACVREVAGVLLRLMYKFLHLTSKLFEKKQRIAAAAKKPRTYAVLEAAKGHDTDQALRSLAGLLLRRPKGVLPQHFTPRLKALRFRLCSCAASSLHILLRVRRNCCPFQVFKVLLGEVDALLQVPPCMRDNLADLILNSYDACLRLPSLVLTFLCIVSEFFNLDLGQDSTQVMKYVAAN